jgi:hypothetical protein
MDFSNLHNLNRPPVAASQLRYGIRVRLPRRDPLRHLLDGDWEKTHWFATAEERDATLADMAGRHPYSRIGDLPNLVYERVER